MTISYLLAQLWYNFEFFFSSTKTKTTISFSILFPEIYLINLYHRPISKVLFNYDSATNFLCCYCHKNQILNFKIIYFIINIQRLHFLLFTIYCLFHQFVIRISLIMLILILWSKIQSLFSLIISTSFVSFFPMKKRKEKQKKNTYL